MKTKGELVSDLELRFTEGKPSDDIEIERDQLAFWLDLAANSLVADQLSKQMSRKEDVNPQYIQPSGYLTAQEEGLAEVNAAYERYSIDISGLRILPFRGKSRDFGVVRVQDNLNKQLVEITYDDSDFYRDLKFACPSSSNQQWYREDGKIYLDGVDFSNVNLRQYRVFYVQSIDSSSLTDAQDYPVGEDILSMIVDIAEEIGWGQLREQPVHDLENDGKQR
jgi:hypothetical protein